VGRRCVEPGQRRLAERGRDGLERGNEVAQELVEILIALVESEPGDRARRGCQPGSQEGGLTCASLS
jgi:hypothetical protein